MVQGVHTVPQLQRHLCSATPSVGLSAGVQRSLLKTLQQQQQQQQHQQQQSQESQMGENGVAVPATGGMLVWGDSLLFLTAHPLLVGELKYKRADAPKHVHTHISMYTQNAAHQ